MIKSHVLYQLSYALTLAARGGMKPRVRRLSLPVPGGGPGAVGRWAQPGCASTKRPGCQGQALRGGQRLIGPGRQLIQRT